MVDQTLKAAPSAVTLLKLGGKVVNDIESLKPLFKALSSHNRPVVVIHGGGVTIDSYLDKLDIAPQYNNGRRITDSQTLDITTMVLAGLMNKRLVTTMQAQGLPAMGLSGADANLVQCVRRPAQPRDYGWVGDVEAVHPAIIQILLQSGYTPVLASVAHNTRGQLLNVNADTVARELAAALVQQTGTAVEMLYCFELPGIYQDIHDQATRLTSLDRERYAAMKASGAIHQGMLVKLENCFEALQAGLDHILISDQTNLASYLAGKPATYTRVIW